MGMVKKDIDAVVHDTEQVYYFTPTEADEELDLNTYRYYTSIHVDVSSYACKITLPNVAEAKGMTYSIRIHVGGTNDLTIQDRDDSEGWTDVTIEDANDTLTVRSNGVQWIIVESTEAD